MSHRLQRLLGSLATGALVAAAFVPTPALAAQPWSVKVGAQSPDKGLQANAFYNNNITVDVGDTVTWSLNTDEIHTVTFLAGTPEPPLVTVIGGQLIPNFQFILPFGGPSYDGTAVANSGLLGFKAPNVSVPPTFSLTFSKPGTYAYVCIVHDGMDGTVTVNPAGTAYPATQAQYDAGSQALQTRLFSQGMSLPGRAFGAAAPDDVTAGIGALVPGGGANATLALLRFVPNTRTIHAGETVTWTNLDPQTPHTVSFPSFAGNPFAAYNPINATCTSTECDATINSPSQVVNSGFIANDPAFEKPNTFKAKFTTPGTYPYICALHGQPGQDGMTGTIVVLP